MMVTELSHMSVMKEKSASIVMTGKKNIAGNSLLAKLKSEPIIGSLFFVGLGIYFMPLPFLSLVLLQ
jgi:hypothetical protein